MIRRFVHRRDFEAFKDETEGKIIKLALNAKDTNQKLDWLITEFMEFKGFMMTHADWTVNAIQGIKQEQVFTNVALKRLEKGQEDLKQDIQGLENRIAERSEALENRIAEKSEALEKRIVEKSEDLENRIMGKLDEIGKKLP